MKQRALVVDDDRYIRLFVNTLLNKEFGEQLDIGLCSNGKEALELVETESYSLVITDVMMPEIDGFELITQLRQSHTMPIIAMSGGFRNADSGSVLKVADSLGADVVIDKADLSKELVNTARLFLGSVT
ncbi:response regulator [Vibrio marisflavi]|uniref:Protein-glutamate methylesterase/protein-glutamine glutaminase n=1 Tax=Vibrio marisflavi CECT 7928 TaxID=634439 RepID=A0ABM9A634_9VIBR|nr:response regulator [Vibrio marisflavi]CAH0540713.1 Protein-glutamate methylesterase/protein-glutamine glutaminase [Vibrio marisflavi CECT 7928]